MKWKSGFLVILAAMLALVPAHAYASLTEAVATVGEGAVEFPVGLLKLVGGAVWTIGEVLIFPFKAIF